MKNLIKLFAFVDERRLNSTSGFQQSQNIGIDHSKQDTTKTSRVVTSPDTTRRSHQYNSVIFKPERYNSSEDSHHFCDCDPTRSTSSLIDSSLRAQHYVTNTTTTAAAAAPSDQVTILEASDCQRSLNSIKFNEQKQKVTNYLGDQSDKHCCHKLDSEELGGADNHEDNNRQDRNVSWLNLGNYLPTFYYYQHNKKLLNSKQQVENNFSTETKTTTTTTPIDDSQRPASNWRNNYKTINLVGQVERATRDSKEVELTREVAARATRTRTTTTKPITTSNSEAEDGWVLLDEQETLIDISDHRGNQTQKNYIRASSSSSSSFSLFNQKNTRKLAHQRKQQMALNEADIELIRASWIPARKDSMSAGVLLFKG